MDLINVMSLLANGTGRGAATGSSSNALSNITSTVMNWLVVAADWLMGFFVSIFYWLIKFMLNIVDFFQFFVGRLAGIDTWSVKGQAANTKLGDLDIIFRFMLSDPVKKAFYAIAGISIVLIIIFTIMAMFKTDYATTFGDDKDGNKMAVLKKTGKGLFLLFVVPFILIFGIIASGAVLSSLNNALKGNTSASIGNQIFSAASYEANRYRLYAQDNKRIATYLGSDFLSERSAFNPDKGNLVVGGIVLVDGTYIFVAPKSDKPDAKLGEYDGVHFYRYEGDIIADTKVLASDVINTKANPTSSDMNVYTEYEFVPELTIDGEVMDYVSGTFGVFNVGNAGTSDKFNIGDSEYNIIQAIYNGWKYNEELINKVEAKSFVDTITKTPTTNDEKIGNQPATIINNNVDVWGTCDGKLATVQEEYYVMADFIDWALQNSIQYYTVNAQNGKIEWSSVNSGTYKSTVTDTVTDITAFAVDYSSGLRRYYDTSYGADVRSEVEGATFIVCTMQNGKYVPITQKNTTFRSSYLKTGYEGVVVARGLFDGTGLGNKYYPTYITDETGDEKSPIVSYYKLMGTTGGIVDNRDNLVAENSDGTVYTAFQEAGGTLTGYNARGINMVDGVELSKLEFSHIKVKNVVYELDSNDNKYQYITVTFWKNVDVSADTGDYVATATVVGKPNTENTAYESNIFDESVVFTVRSLDYPALPNTSSGTLESYVSQITYVRQEVASGLAWDFSFGMPNKDGGINDWYFRFKLGMLKNASSIDVYHLSAGSAILDYNFNQTTGIKMAYLYKTSELNIIILLFATILVFGVLSQAVWGLIMRIYEITLLFIVLPGFVSMIPIDEGRFGSWKSQVVSKVLSTYGVVIGLNLFFVLLPVIRDATNLFNEGDIPTTLSGSGIFSNVDFLNRIVQLMFMLVAFTLIRTLPKMVADLIGAGEVYGEGKGVKDNVSSAVSNVADAVSGKTAIDSTKKLWTQTKSFIPGKALFDEGKDYLKKRKDQLEKKHAEGEKEAGTTEADKAADENQRQLDKLTGKDQGEGETAEENKAESTADGKADARDRITTSGDKNRTGISEDLTQEVPTDNALADIGITPFNENLDAKLAENNETIDIVDSVLASDIVNKLDTNVSDEEKADFIANNQTLADGLGIDSAEKLTSTDLFSGLKNNGIDLAERTEDALKEEKAKMEFEKSDNISAQSLLAATDGLGAKLTAATDDEARASLFEEQKALFESLGIEDVTKMTEENIVAALKNKDVEINSLDATALTAEKSRLEAVVKEQDKALGYIQGLLDNGAKLNKIDDMSNDDKQEFLNNNKDLLKDLKIDSADKLTSAALFAGLKANGVDITTEALKLVMNEKETESRNMVESEAMASDFAGSVADNSNAQALLEKVYESAIGEKLSVANTDEEKGQLFEEQKALLESLGITDIKKMTEKDIVAALKGKNVKVKALDTDSLNAEKGRLEQFNKRAELFDARFGGAFGETRKMFLDVARGDLLREKNAKSDNDKLEELKQFINDNMDKLSSTSGLVGMMGVQTLDPDMLAKKVQNNITASEELGKKIAAETDAGKKNELEQQKAELDKKTNKIEGYLKLQKSGLLNDKGNIDDSALETIEGLKTENDKIIADARVTRDKRDSLENAVKELENKLSDRVATNSMSESEFRKLCQKCEDLKNNPYDADNEDEYAMSFSYTETLNQEINELLERNGQASNESLKKMIADGTLRSDTNKEDVLGKIYSVRNAEDLDKNKQELEKIKKSLTGNFDNKELTEKTIERIDAEIKRIAKDLEAAKKKGDKNEIGVLEAKQKALDTQKELAHKGVAFNDAPVEKKSKRGMSREEKAAAKLEDDIAKIKNKKPRGYVSDARRARIEAEQKRQIDLLKENYNRKTEKLNLKAKKAENKQLRINALKSTALGSAITFQPFKRYLRDAKGLSKYQQDGTVAAGHSGRTGKKTVLGKYYTSNYYKKKVANRETYLNTTGKKLHGPFSGGIRTRSAVNKMEIAKNAQKAAQEFLQSDATAKYLSAAGEKTKRVKAVKDMGSFYEQNGKTIGKVKRMIKGSLNDEINEAIKKVRESAKDLNASTIPSKFALNMMRKSVERQEVRRIYRESTELKKLKESKYSHLHVSGKVGKLKARQDYYKTAKNANGDTVNKIGGSYLRGFKKMNQEVKKSMVAEAKTNKGIAKADKVQAKSGMSVAKQKKRETDAEYEARINRVINGTDFKKTMDKALKKADANGDARRAGMIVGAITKDASGKQVIKDKKVFDALMKELNAEAKKDKSTAKVEADDARRRYGTKVMKGRTSRVELKTARRRADAGRYSENAKKYDKVNEAHKESLSENRKTVKNMDTAKTTAVLTAEEKKKEIAKYNAQLRRVGGKRIKGDDRDTVKSAKASAVDEKKLADSVAKTLEGKFASKIQHAVDKSIDKAVTAKMKATQFNVDGTSRTLAQHLKELKRQQNELKNKKKSGTATDSELTALKNDIKKLKTNLNAEMKKGSQTRKTLEDSQRLARKQALDRARQENAEKENQETSDDEGEEPK